MNLCFILQSWVFFIIFKRIKKRDCIYALRVIRCHGLLSRYYMRLLKHGATNQQTYLRLGHWPLHRRRLVINIGEGQNKNLWKVLITYEYSQTRFLNGKEDFYWPIWQTNSSILKNFWWLYLVIFIIGGKGFPHLICLGARVRAAPRVYAYGQLPSASLQQWYRTTLPIFCVSISLKPGNSATTSVLVPKGSLSSLRMDSILYHGSCINPFWLLGVSDIPLCSLRMNNNWFILIFYSVILLAALYQLWYFPIKDWLIDDWLIDAWLTDDWLIDDWLIDDWSIDIDWLTEHKDRQTYRLKNEEIYKHTDRQTNAARLSFVLILFWPSVGMSVCLPVCYSMYSSVVRPPVCLAWSSYSSRGSSVSAGFSCIIQSHNASAANINIRKQTPCALSYCHK